MKSEEAMKVVTREVHARRTSTTFLANAPVISSWNGTRFQPVTIWITLDRQGNDPWRFHKAEAKGYAQKSDGTIGKRSAYTLWYDEDLMPDWIVQLVDSERSDLP